MPLIANSAYFRAPWWQPEGHTQTILPAYRRVTQLPPKKTVRIVTPDFDFLDIDFYEHQKYTHHKKIAILTHGLEGNSTRPYMVGMVKVFFERGFDVAAWNCRSCSKEMNRCLRLYNHGEIDDLRTILQLVQTNYDEIVLIGFSMGANIALKLAALDCPPSVSFVFGVSAPLDLKDSMDVLFRYDNILYKKLFENQLKRKLFKKAKQFPNEFDISKFDNLKTWEGCLAAFAFVNGYRDASEYLYAGTPLHFLDRLKIPSYILQAENDPMLTEKCLPKQLAEEHPFFYLETTSKGGHVGFSLGKKSPTTYTEQRALAMYDRIALDLNVMAL